MMKIKRKIKDPVKACKKQQKKKKHTIPPEGRKKDGQFKKGVSGNPAGSKKGPRRQGQLLAAIEAVETKRGDNWLEHQIEKSYDDVALATAILARLHPSLKAIEMSGGISTIMLDEEAKAIQDELKKNHA